MKQTFVKCDYCKVDMCDETGNVSLPFTNELLTVKNITSVVKATLTSLREKRKNSYCFFRPSSSSKRFSCASRVVNG